MNSRKVMLLGVDIEEVYRLDNKDQALAKIMKFPYMVEVEEQEKGYPLFKNKFDDDEDWCLIFFKYIELNLTLKYLL